MTAADTARRVEEGLERSIPLQLCAAYALAGLFYVVMAYAGRRLDCAPPVADGQCGMTAFAYRLYGAAGAAAIVIGLHVLSARLYLARRRRGGADVPGRA